jgi:hypothetical protein
MYKINEDNSIYVTRGDVLLFEVNASDDGQPYTFKNGDILRIKITEKKNCGAVVLQKDFLVGANTEVVEVFLDKGETKIGDVISKPTDYWYEIELNPDTNPQTIVGYDEESGAKIFRLYPEGGDL